MSEEQSKEKKKKGIDWKLLVDLYQSFFRIGILTFGGGLTMLPMLTYEVVEKRGWTTEEELLDCYAIGQCTPGIIAVNTATYVGYKKHGILGGIFATLGMVSPSVIIITIIAAFLKPFMDNKWLQHALMGVRGIVCALMMDTVLKLAKKSLVHPISWGICLIVFVLALFSPVPTIILVIIAAVSGILLGAKFMVEAKGTTDSKGTAGGKK